MRLHLACFVPGILSVASIFVSSALCPAAVMMCPIYFTVSTLNWIASLFNFTFVVFALYITFCRISSCSRSDDGHDHGDGGAQGCSGPSRDQRQ